MMLVRYQLISSSHQSTISVVPALRLDRASFRRKQPLDKFDVLLSDRLTVDRGFTVVYLCTLSFAKCLGCGVDAGILISPL